MDRADFDYSSFYRQRHDENESHAAAHAAHIRDLLGPFLPPPGAGAVLDIGCGIGCALVALRNWGFTNVQGIDIDREQVKSCQRRRLPVELVEDSTLFLLEHVSEFELILMLDVLEHVPVSEQIPLMRAVCSALDPGGRVILTVPNASSLVATRWRYGDFTHCSTFTEHSLRFVLKNAGFENIQIPGQGPLRRPPLRLWRRSSRVGLMRWLVRYLWRLVLAIEVGDFEQIENISLDLDLIATAFRPARAILV
jgi:SAM-dependent methyltransferase